MFEKYNNLETYIPNNLNYELNNVKNYTCPYKIDDNNQTRLGYFWHYGDTINLQFDLVGYITVETNSIIYTISNESPDENTVGNIDQKAYNITDLKSWTCTAIIDNRYIWAEDNEFIYPDNGDTDVYLSAKEYLQGKKLKISFYNFRYEPFFEATLNADNLVTLSIDKELSEKFVKGVYYLTLELYDDIANTYISILHNEDCIIEVR